MRRGAWLGAAALALTGALALVQPQWATFAVFFLVQVGIYGLLALGLNLQWGFTGLFNVGVASLFALGAYTSALLTKAPVSAAGEVTGLGWPVGLGWLAGMGVAGLAALLLGAATLRLRGHYLAMATLGAGEIVRLILLNESWLTHGPEGLRAIPQPGAAWLAARDYNVWYLAIVWALLVLCLWGVQRLMRSPWGRAVRAIRDDEGAAGTLGKHAFRFKLQAFVVGAMLMGLAGGLYAHFTTFISPADFEPLQTFLVWMMLIVGGSGNNRGALLGALIVWSLWVGTNVLSGALPSLWAVKLAYLRVIAIGLALQWMLIHRPQGLLGQRRQRFGLLDRR